MHRSRAGRGNRRSGWCGYWISGRGAGAPNSGSTDRRSDRRGQRSLDRARERTRPMLLPRSIRASHRRRVSSRLLISSIDVIVPTADMIGLGVRLNGERPSSRRSHFCEGQGTGIACARGRSCRRALTLAHHRDRWLTGQSIPSKRTKVWSCLRLLPLEHLTPGLPRIDR